MATESEVGTRENPIKVDSLVGKHFHVEDVGLELTIDSIKCTSAFQDHGTPVVTVKLAAIGGPLIRDVQWWKCRRCHARTSTEQKAVYQKKSYIPTHYCCWTGKQDALVREDT